MEVYRKKSVMHAYFIYKKYILKRKRQYWIHPFTDAGLMYGTLHTSFANLREHPENFSKYLRISVRSFKKFSARNTNRIQSQDT